MTYRLGIAVDVGLVLASDSRTNAGIDYVTSYSKLHLFTPAADRLFVLLSAGNLATTQEIMNRVRRDLSRAEQGRLQAPTLASVDYLFEAADYLGRVSLAVQDQHGPALAQQGISAQATLILGGQIAGQPPGLYMIYPQGNYFAASPETPYLQIGENKYGKPVLDRLARSCMVLEDAARLCLVSLDATARSNVTVGPPYELALYPRNALALSHRLKLEPDAPLLAAASQSWDQGLQRAFAGLPRFDWEGAADTRV
jgi:putative proteasome-type protease